MRAFPPSTRVVLSLKPLLFAQYLVAPVEQVPDTQGGDDAGAGDDGEELKVLRPSKEKLCFPAVC